MKFSNTVRRREVAFMIRLLTIFGVVEQRQMRLLFDHMSNRSYGQILARLRQEGLAYFSPDGQFLATSRYSLDHGKTQEAIMAFWAFIQMRDHVLDFCASEPPAILSFSSADKDYDLISGSQRNIPSINASRTLVPEASVRLIVVDDMKSLDELIPRDDNDYGVLTGSDGVEQTMRCDMDNPKYIQVMRQVASDFDGISHELFQVASDLERMDQYNPQQKLFSLVRSAEVSSVTLRNLTARTVRDDTAPFYCEVADLLGIKVEETHDWLKISVPAILPKRNQRDNQAFLTRPLRYAIMDYLKENPMERFGSCAICIVHNYDAALGKRRIRDYDNIETKRYLDVIESMLLTNDSGLLCTVLQATRMSDRDSAEFYLMRPETLSSWAKNHIKTTTKTCSE